MNFAASQNVRDAVEGHLNEIGCISAEGDIALVLGRMYRWCPLIERLRGSEPGPVVRLTPARVASLLSHADPEDLRTFLSTSTNVAKVLVASGDDYFCICILSPKRRHLELVSQNDRTAS